MKTLEKLFDQSKHFSTKWKKYFQIYEKIFNKYRNKKIIFVEIGIFQGGSLDIWKNYFGKSSRIIGIDLNPKCKKFRNKKKNIDVFIGDQSNPIFWKNFFKKVGNVDIILDDGGHTNKQQILTVLNTIKNINDDGKLVIEDTHTSYLPKFGNPNKYSFINFTKQIIDQINYTFPFSVKKKFKNEINKYVYGLSFYESIVEFKINRKQCIENKFLQNSGKSSGFEDFRNDNSNLIKILKNIKTRTNFFKRIKLQKLNYFIENFFLKKYF